VDGETGSGIGGASLSIFFPGIFRDSSSNGSGEFRFDWLTPGEYRLWAWGPGFWCCEKKVEIRPGDSSIGDVFLFRTLLVQGQVVDKQTGMPVKGAEVCVGEPDGVSVTTDSAGRFSMRISKRHADTSLIDAMKRRLALEVLMGDAFRGSHYFNASQALPPSGVVDMGRIALERQREVTDE
jgi:hypothetical protein